MQLTNAVIAFVTLAMAAVAAPTEGAGLAARTGPPPVSTCAPEQKTVCCDDAVCLLIGLIDVPLCGFLGGSSFCCTDNTIENGGFQLINIQTNCPLIVL
ncbi:hypothetical protein B0T16DRAFT_462906 [Cercophora newfieldiana]|uniref:Hydrophobin n=1 Tax=Cercophora newfieldiana TaxID=92897 RepID=A0AA39XT70_9PEZI|nr:hypothetical protein B0T16DRAFT_462906 [Cercophora newfieldiana]